MKIGTKIKEFLKEMFTSDPKRRAKNIEVLQTNLAALKTHFIKEAQKAGFTKPQAEFMWLFLSHSQHQHEYYHELGAWTTTVPITEGEFHAGYNERWPTLERWFGTPKP